jgi:hypothetical protein
VNELSRSRTYTYQPLEALFTSNRYLWLDGELPFSLPAAQRSAAVAHGETVEMTLYVIHPVSGSQVPVHVLMTGKVADGLIVQLLEVLTGARKQVWKG